MICVYLVIWLMRDVGFPIRWDFKGFVVFGLKYLAGRDFWVLMLFALLVIFCLFV